MGIFREGLPGSNLPQNESIPVIKAQKSIKKYTQNQWKPPNPKSPQNFIISLLL